MNKKSEQFLPLILIILDGWGLNSKKRGNAVAQARTPNFDELKKKYPFTKLKAHGQHVGLPQDQVGNSEAGHMNIGGGRVVEQDAVRINRDVVNGNFFKNSALLSVVKHVRQNNSRLHLMGMVSNGMSPHSDIEHIIGLLELARRYKIKQVYLHLFTDGRDSPQYQSVKLIKYISGKLHPGEEIVTVMGRFYAMDRKKNWSRTSKAYHALVQGKNVSEEKSFGEGLVKNYNRGNTDEFVEPFKIDDTKNKKRIRNGDGVIFFNLRSDRARQLTKAFVQKKFNQMNPRAFRRKKVVRNLMFVAMTNFGPDLGDIKTAYPDIKIDNTLPESLQELSQLYVAETEKYAHVSYFFNGGKAGKVNGEDYFILSSPDVRSYEEAPEMKTRELGREIIKNVRRNKYDVTVVNFAAPDMIGHTGNLKAAVQACEILDKNLGEIVREYIKRGGTVLVTADHGNAEQMIDPDTEQINTQHTINPVPFIVINDQTDLSLRSGILADIAPTVLDLVGIKKPREMSGKTLIVHADQVSKNLRLEK